MPFKLPVDTSIRDHQGRTLLHLAAQTNQHEIVEYLLKNKICSITARDNDSNTPLHTAAASHRTEIAQYLIQQGADPTATNNRGETCYDLDLKVTPPKQGNSFDEPLISFSSGVQQSPPPSHSRVFPATSSNAGSPVNNRPLPSPPKTVPSNGKPFSYISPQASSNNPFSYTSSPSSNSNPFLFSEPTSPQSSTLRPTTGLSKTQPYVPKPETAEDNQLFSSLQEPLVRKASEIFPSLKFSGGSNSSTSSNNSNSSSISMVIQNDDIGYEIDPKTNQPLELGRGSFGVVYRGFVRGTSVAIKHLSLAGNDMSAIEQEVEFMRNLPHPNVLQFMGLGNSPNCIITEFISGGDLWSWVEKHKKNQNDIGHCAWTELDALKKVAHRDLKPQNLLVTSEGVVKIADFGLSKVSSSVSNLNKKSADIAGTPKYLAPELLDRKKPKDFFKADIYSLGILLWEFFAAKEAFKDLEDEGLQTFFFAVMGGERPQKEPDMNPALYELLAKCWEADVTKRPSLDSLESSLKHLGT
eukprot:CAMPEP_0168570156 /NCGR_PEP_ID=MMETSP0413-20121227/16567_1 /TAXON_ID=136452 /ORGANISM="Filamoeba nolandi, Strain NC-AS-23-1" /LENGTH=524 /DNA_ID=CAMNT_0008602753 /DNA_START=138 /DNA_END=1714 /DNA_ORIENTATION=-